MKKTNGIAKAFKIIGIVFAGCIVLKYLVYLLIQPLVTGTISQVGAQYGDFFQILTLLFGLVSELFPAIVLFGIGELIKQVSHFNYTNDEFDAMLDSLEEDDDSAESVEAPSENKAE